MRVLAVILFCVSILASGYTPKEAYFEGYVITRHTYESKRLNTDSLAANNSTGSLHYYNYRYYKGYTYNADTSIYIYNSEINQAIWFKMGDETVQCMSYGENMGAILKKAYTKPKTVEIKGHTCKVIVMEYENQTTTYFVTDKYKLNPNLYKNHVAFYFKKRMKMSGGGIPMRTEIKYKSYTKIIETEEIVQEPIDEGKFSLLWFHRCP